METITRRRGDVGRSGGAPDDLPGIFAARIVSLRGGIGRLRDRPRPTANCFPKDWWRTWNRPSLFFGANEVRQAKRLVTFTAVQCTVKAALGARRGCK